MDEPFGATDPITREKLQAEFLRLQSEIGKTIIVVTHDFDEAIRLGDRIAVLSDRSQIEQFDTPAAISLPAPNRPLGNMDHRSSPRALRCSL